MATRVSLTYQPLIRQPLPKPTCQHGLYPVQRMPLDASLVQPEGELVDIAVEMLEAGVMIDAVQTALDDGPRRPPRCWRAPLPLWKELSVRRRTRSSSHSDTPKSLFNIEGFDLLRLVYHRQREAVRNLREKGFPSLASEKV